jgi:hypothetical protein
MKKLQLLIISFFLFYNLRAQNIEIGLTGGGAVYNGDIDVSAQNFLPQTRANIGAFVRVLLPASFVLRGQLGTGMLYANEKKYSTSDYRAKRGFSFNTNYTELSGRIEWHFLRLDNSFSIEKYDPTMSLYSFGGVGAIFFNPRVNYNLPNPYFDNVALDKDAKFSKITPTLSIGGGSKFYVSDNLALGLEVCGNKSFSDYLDGISKVITSKAPDYYFTFNLMVSYNFGDKSNGEGNGFFSKRNRQKNGGCPTF